MARQAAAMRSLEDERAMRPVVAPGDWNSMLARNDIVIDTAQGAGSAITITEYPNNNLNWLRLGGASRAVEAGQLAQFFYDNLFARKPNAATVTYRDVVESLEYNSVPLRSLTTVRAKVSLTGNLRPLPISED
jgi:hypothetical protein